MPDLHSITLRHTSSRSFKRYVAQYTRGLPGVGTLLSMKAPPAFIIRFITKLTAVSAAVREYPPVRLYLFLELERISWCSPSRHFTLKSKTNHGFILGSSSNFISIQFSLTSGRPSNLWADLMNKGTSIDLSKNKIFQRIDVDGFARLGNMSPEAKSI